MPSSTDAGAAPSGALRWEFWVLVLILNVALLTTALGALVILFWARPLLGVGLLVVGVGAGGYAWHRFKRVKAAFPAN